MKLEQTCWTQARGWEPEPPGRLGMSAQLVLLFGATAILKAGIPLNEMKQLYPRARFMGCSTAGEIFGTQVLDDSLVVTAVQFESTTLQGVSISLAEAGSSLAAGYRLAQSFKHEGLVHVFVLSDGLAINGTELVKGLMQYLPSSVTVTGGLSGDGDRFHETLVLLDGPPQPHIITALGFYGNRIAVGYGSLGGWDPFGPERLITRAEGNVLYELDGKSALALYAQYLGEHAKGLPATGLFFPLSIRIPGEEHGVVRTILSTNPLDESLTFAGEIPEGTYARLMKANFDRLIDGAVGAARTSYEALGSSSPDLAVLISCVGRKLVLKQRIEEEVESVREILGNRTVLAGFYSYGEISPFTRGAKCELHNQTMTVTTFSEREK
ncbi:MAG: hypothetical protein EPO61_00405 [Nitrospirae bacterium]|nr:MAG: hypothetical protein EPO61_00405 [Nitrospirota bacterium]